MSRASTVTLTGPQVRILHEVLSMIENDPDWIDLLGGQRRMDTLYRAHSAILLGRHGVDECPNGGPRCPPSECDCFVDHCPECAAGRCHGIHPEFFSVIHPEEGP